VPRDELAMALLVTESLAPEIGALAVVSDEHVAQVSVIGAGMKTHPGVTATMFEVLAARGINIEMISTSPIRISCVVAANSADDAVRALHDAFELEGPPQVAR
jgi:aspartate kinase